MTLLLLLYLAAAPKYDPAVQFIETLCVYGLSRKSMPADESRRFCRCVSADISPGLSPSQRSILATAKADLDRGRAPNQQQFNKSGVRDLVIAAQARCEAAFYPPAASITMTSGALHLTLRCDDQTGGPAIILYIRGGALLSEAEINASIDRMMNGKFDSQYAVVGQVLDGKARWSERWEIDVTGQIVSSPKPADLLKLLRRGSSYSVVIQRGVQRHAGTFLLSGRIPPRWVPCGGVSR